MYIIDQEQIDNIYNNLNNLDIYSFEGTSIIDPALDIGDILVIDNKKIVYQGSIEYIGKFKASISSKLQCKSREETTTRISSQTVVNRRVQSQIDQSKGKIEQLIEENSENSEQISQIVQEIDNITSTVISKDDIYKQINELKQNIEGTTNKLIHSGGNNIFYYSKDYWEKNSDEKLSIEEYSNTDIQQNTISKLGYIVNNGNAIQKQIVKNGMYTISFLYKKLVDLSAGYLLVNGTKYDFDVKNINEWKEQVITIEITSNTIDLEIVSNTDNSFIVADLMIGAGSEKQVWSQNANETLTDTVKIGKGIQVESSSSNTYTRIDSDGNRTYNKTTNEIVAEMTDKGVYSNELEIKGQAKVNLLLIQEIDSQIWMTGIGG